MPEGGKFFAGDGSAVREDLVIFILPAVADGIFLIACAQIEGFSQDTLCVVGIGVAALFYIHNDALRMIAFVQQTQDIGT